MHFPGHAQKSAEIYKALFPQDTMVAELIESDMLIHSGTSPEVSAKLQTHPRLVINLLLSALAEVHANSLLFGGSDSTSFKIKLKKITQRTKLVYKFLSH